MATVVLVGAEYEENLSLRYLAASVQRVGFRAEIVPFNSASGLEEAVRCTLSARPVVVGISVPFQLRAVELLSFASHLRSSGFSGHICVGGHFVTFEYRNILRDFPSIDSVVRHEGEETFAWLCARVRDGLPVDAAPGMVVRGVHGVESGAARVLPPLDSLAFPDRRGEPHSVLGINVAPLVGSRGCYADCSFCCIYAWGDNANGPRYRRRSVESIVAEMRELYLRRGVRMFVFHDDNFFMPTVKANLERYQRFAELLREEGMTDIGLVIKARPNDVDRELFALLKSIGLVRAYVGIETNSDEGIVSLNRRITPEDNRRAIRILRELEIYNSFNVLIFDPEATLDGVARNLDFLDEHVDIPFNFCRAEVYAGTPLKRILEEENRLSGDYFAWGYRMRDPCVELLFRMMVVAFNRRNFDSDGVHNLNMGIRCDLEVVRRFHPHVWTRALHDEAVALSMEIGADSVAHMRRALSFCREHDPYDALAVKRFSLAMARAVSAADLRFVARMQRLRSVVEQKLRAPGSRPGWPVWAAESKRLASSSGRELSAELLPAPTMEPERVRGGTR
jgi:anaerobic magnesium-protoporphyrin IX monomethyl ester cyclase